MQDDWLEGFSFDERVSFFSDLTTTPIPVEVSPLVNVDFESFEAGTPFLSDSNGSPTFVLFELLKMSLVCISSRISLCFVSIPTTAKCIPDLKFVQQNSQMTTSANFHIRTSTRVSQNESQD